MKEEAEKVQRQKSFFLHKYNMLLFSAVSTWVNFGNRVYWGQTESIWVNWGPLRSIMVIWGQSGVIWGLLKSIRVNQGWLGSIKVNWGQSGSVGFNWGQSESIGINQSQLWSISALFDMRNTISLESYYKLAPQMFKIDPLCHQYWCFILCRDTWLINYTDRLRYLYPSGGW